MRLPHLPDPTKGARDAVADASHQFADVTKRVLKHIDNAEHAANENMRRQFDATHKPKKRPKRR